jgi:hypothetical protein
MKVKTAASPARTRSGRKTPVSGGRTMTSGLRRLQCANRDESRREGEGPSHFQHGVVAHGSGLVVLQKYEASNEAC